MCDSKEQLLASNLLQDQQGKSEHFEFLRVTLTPLLVVVIKPAGRADARIPVLRLTLRGHPFRQLGLSQVLGNCKKRKNQTTANRENCKTTACPGALIGGHQKITYHGDARNVFQPSQRHGSLAGHLYSSEALADTPSVSCLDAEAIWNAPPRAGSLSFYLYLPL